MTTSSVPATYSITLDDDLVSSISLDTITLSSSPSYVSIGAGSAYTVGTTSTISIPSFTSTTSTSTISGIDWGIKINEEWVNSFPEWARIEAMCKEYPGLKIAFDKFKTTYYLVKDDYDTPKDKK